MPQTKDEPIVQQLLDGKYITEAHETKIYNIIEAKGAGISLRYTDRSAETATEHYDDLNKKHGAPKARAYRHEWILNRMKAKGYHPNDKLLLEAIHALHAVFWDAKANKVRKDFIDSRVEEIEYTEIKTFKLTLRLRSAVWESKLEAWSVSFSPTKPKDVRKRQEKALKAKALFAVWMAKHLKPVKGQVCTPKESNAYQKLLIDHIVKQIEDKHKADVPQSKLEV